MNLPGNRGWVGWWEQYGNSRFSLETLSLVIFSATLAQLCTQQCGGALPTPSVWASFFSPLFLLLLLSLLALAQSEGPEQKRDTPRTTGAEKPDPENDPERLKRDTHLVSLGPTGAF